MNLSERGIYMCEWPQAMTADHAAAWVLSGRTPTEAVLAFPFAWWHDADDWYSAMATELAERSPA